MLRVIAVTDLPVTVAAAREGDVVIVLIDPGAPREDVLEGLAALQPVLAEAGWDGVEGYSAAVGRALEVPTASGE